jgi:hypothetical protein
MIIYECVGFVAHDYPGCGWRGSEPLRDGLVPACPRCRGIVTRTNDLDAEDARGVVTSRTFELSCELRAVPAPPTEEQARAVIALAELLKAPRPSATDWHAAAEHHWHEIILPPRS